MGEGREREREKETKSPSHMHAHTQIATDRIASDADDNGLSLLFSLCRCFYNENRLNRRH